MPETVKKIADKLAEILEKNPDFHGKIEINLFGGKCPNINVCQSIKIEK